MSPQALFFLVAFHVSHAVTLSGVVATKVSVAPSHQEHQHSRPLGTKQLMRRQTARAREMDSPTVVDQVQIASEDGNHTVQVMGGGATPPLCEDLNYQAFMKKACAQVGSLEPINGMQTRRSCKYDEIQGKIVCDYVKECEGGELSSWPTKSVFHHASFQCDSCDDSHGKVLRLPCCHECKRLQTQAVEYWKDPEALDPVKMDGTVLADVQCHGCDDQAELDAIAQNDTENNKLCERDSETGAFYCHFVGSCSTGKPRITTREEENVCINTPCDACGDEVLQAQCCAKCLSDICQSSDDGDSLRQVCTGCVTGLTNFLNRAEMTQMTDEATDEQESIEAKTPDEEEAPDGESAGEEETSETPGEQEVQPERGSTKNSRQSRTQDTAKTTEEETQDGESDGEEETPGEKYVDEEETTDSDTE